MIVGSNLDLNKNQLIKAALHPVSTAPTSPVEGQVYFNTTGGDKTLYYWNGTSWVALTASGIPADASTTVKGISKLSVAPVSSTSPIVVGDNDTRVTADQAAGTASIRTLGFSGNAAMPGTARHDQIAAPTASVSWGSQRLTNLLTDGSSASTDAATVGYVNSVAQGLDAKASVRAATTGPGTLASSFQNGSAIDGITLATGDRILIKDQSSASENGIYTVNASGAPTRALDADAWTELPGAYVWVEVGTTNADSGWVCTVDQGGTLNTTAVTWTLFASATSLVAGAGLNKTGNTIDVVATDTSLTVNANDLQVRLATNSGLTVSSGLKILLADSSLVLSGSGLALASGYTKKFATTVGNGSLTAISVTHSLGTSDVHVAVRKVSTGDLWLVDTTVVDANSVQLNFATAPATNEFAVAVIG